MDQPSETTPTKQLEELPQTAERTKCEIWTRVMGYHRPVSQYNFGKKSEFYSRLYFEEEASFNSDFIKKYSITT